MIILLYSIYIYGIHLYCIFITTKCESHIGYLLCFYLYLNDFQLFISKTGKQKVFPIETFYDIEQNYDLKPPTIKKDVNCLGRGWGSSILYRHLVYFFWCLFRILFNVNAGLFSAQSIFFFKVNYYIQPAIYIPKYLKY